MKKTVKKKVKLLLIIFYLTQYINIIILTCNIKKLLMSHFTFFFYAKFLKYRMYLHLHLNLNWPYFKFSVITCGCGHCIVRLGPSCATPWVSSVCPVLCQLMQGVFCCANNLWPLSYDLSVRTSPTMRVVILCVPSEFLWVLQEETISSISFETPAVPSTKCSTI